MHERSSTLHAHPDALPLFRELGIDADAVFTHPDIQAWRRLPDRENCTLDFKHRDGSRGRWHVKRYLVPNNGLSPAQVEIAGHQSLRHALVPTADLIGWGRVADGRSFVIFDDLTGFQPSDKWLEAGGAFDSILRPTADLTAHLHRRGLHHRDLYLCHFMVRVSGAELPEVRLIDPARVTRLPRLFRRGRWIVKDLAQFWYSSLCRSVTDGQRQKWIERYAQQRHLPGHLGLVRQVARKATQIARHDQRVNRLRPQRNVSIPVEGQAPPPDQSE